MKTVAVTIIMALIIFNVALYPFWYAAPDDDDDDWNNNGGNGDPDVVPIDAISVKVPPLRAGDIMQYDYEFLAEIYEKNKTSGNWSIIKLEANGQLLEQVSGVGSQRDGYYQSHEAWSMHTALSLSVRITIEEHSPGGDNEPLIVIGTIEISRDKHSTIDGDIPIMTYAGGSLSVDEIKGLDIPVADFTFDVDNWGYPDPNLDPEPPLEERIYGKQAVLTEGDNGTYGQYDPEWNYTQYYNWSIDQSARVRDYDSVRLNISLDFFGFIQLDKLIWLSSDVPRPVGVEYYSGTFWNEVNNTGHIILSTSQLLAKNGYTRGGSVVPIDYDSREQFVSRHATADFRAWEITPDDGTLSSSSFDLGMEEAVSFALENDPGLQQWVSEHPSPYITEGFHYANATDLRTTEYIWNLTFSDEPKDWDNYEDWMPTNAYYINVTRRVTTRVIGGDDVETFIDTEHGEPRAYWGYARIAEEDISEEMLTLAASEDVWSQFSNVRTKAYTGLEQRVDFTDARYFYGIGGLDFAGGFGLDLLDQLTGIDVPNADLSWTLQVGNVWEGGNTLTATIDAETGRMVNIMQVEGPQSLALIFGVADSD
jgi:hypothetical protein